MTRRALWAGTGCAAVLLWLAAAAVEPARGVLPCPVRGTVGLPCPGCGMTRALLHVAHGEWKAALRFHPLAPVLLGEAVVLWIGWGLREAGRVRLPARRTVNGWLFVHATLLLAIWLARLASGSLPW